jgi:hypothetical protein
MPHDAKDSKKPELSKAEAEEVRKKIVESIVTQLRRPGGFYGYTQSAGNNYGKYERE